MFKRKKNPPPPPPEKRKVFRHSQYGMGMYLDDVLERVLEGAGILYDADEVIACLGDSPRFRRLVCKRAEEKAEQLRKDLAAAEEAARKACRISQEDAS